MIKNKTIAFCMTSDYAFDQRMQRISNSLCKENIGIIIHRDKKRTELKSNHKLISLDCIKNKGVLFYIEFNLRLFFKLFSVRADIIYAVDTDTLLAVGLYNIFKSKITIYDSHELFTEVPELKGKDTKKKIWQSLEKWQVPKMSLNLTVGDKLAEILSEKYRSQFHAIKNVPYADDNNKEIKPDNIIIYQGAINEGRGLHCAIEAMEFLEDYKLILVGEGDIKNELKEFLNLKSYKERIEIREAMLPHKLKELTDIAMFGLNLIENTSLNYYYSLANKFFDYLQSEVPSINMKFPEYENILKEKPFGLMVNELDPKELANAIINNSNQLIYKGLVESCKKYKSEFTWEKEEQKLLIHFNSLVKFNKHIH